ncbi:unnamed protein product [Porites evermanni]|uniref:G-protein coupled receptors family 1 profile domain-containing protein n=1 Tax=Porites evermanni TaxID=104178 RepID=A0ABN8SSZ8_9CNID|nr:unnamed protein product [Porites evermanni]
MVPSASKCITWNVIFAAEIVAIVTVNLLSIILFIKTRSLRTPSMYLVISLTVADMEVVITLLFFFPLVSLTNIAMISLERVHATFRPIEHRTIRKWVYVVAIAVVWVLPVITSVTSMVVLLMTGYYLFFYGFHCCLCLFVICVSYIAILIKFRCGAHPLRHFATSSKQRKLTVTLFITTLVSLLLWLPYHILVIVNLKTSGLPRSFPRLVAVRLGYSLFVLFYANSLVNPVLYTIRIPDFKRAFFSLFRRQ